MHILHIYKDYYPVLGGIENNIRDLAEGFVRRGHTVTVLATNRGLATREESINGVRVIKAGRIATFASTPLSLSLPGLLRLLTPDITHLHVPYPWGEAAQWLTGRGRPYVLTYHAEATRPLQLAIMRLYAPVFRRVLRGAGRILATSPNYVASSPFLPAVRERVSIVPLGVPPGRFAPPDGGPPHPPTLLFVGLLRHYKGVDVLLRAVPRLPGDVRLQIAGEGPMRAEWEALSHSLGLQERVTFLGRVPDEDLPRLYQSADLFVLPATSRAEAFGLVMVEAMLSGLPCVTTDVGSGTAYVVKDHVTGLVVPPRSTEALAAALNRLLADPGLRVQMGRAGRERALGEFTLDTMLARVDDIYRAVLSARRIP
jgi:rhamnosyl/mannosyltransferase